MVYEKSYNIFIHYRVEILMGCGNKLVAPSMASGQILTGYMIHKIFGTKAVYLRPQVELIAAKVKIDVRFAYSNKACTNILMLARLGFTANKNNWLKKLFVKGYLAEILYKTFQEFYRMPKKKNKN